MGRYAKAGVTEEDLKQMIEDNGGLGEIVYNDKLKVYKDLLKVDMDFDHIGLLSESGFGSAKDIPSYETFTKDGKSYPVAWCYANAEGDEPVAFVVYVGQEGKLRAFIPNDGNNFSNAHHRDGKEARTSSERPWWHNDSKGDYYFDYQYMRKSVEKRIDVKGENGSGKGGESPLTFRQIIQSLKDYEDQHASVMPVAEGAEDPVWGIDHIWFEDGVLNLGQYDDEGDSCSRIAMGIEGCVPADLLDEVAVVRIGVAEEDDDGKRELYDPYGEVSEKHTVKSSVVKALPDDDWFCKWILKFA